MMGPWPLCILKVDIFQRTFKYVFLTASDAHACLTYHIGNTKEATDLIYKEG